MSTDPQLALIEARPNNLAYGPEDRAYLLAIIKRVETLASDWDATHEVFPRSAAGILAKAHANQLRAAIDGETP